MKGLITYRTKRQAALSVNDYRRIEMDVKENILSFMIVISVVSYPNSRPAFDNGMKVAVIK